LVVRQTIRRALNLLLFETSRMETLLWKTKIFGPILPIVPVDNLSDAIEFINSRPHALVLYGFTEDEGLKQRLIDNTRSGNIVFNDVFQQMDVSELPFGGVGESGYGHQVLKAAYDGFTHLRSSVDVPKSAEKALQVRYAPYTEENFKIMAANAFLKIPSKD